MNPYFTPETFTPVDHFTREVQIDREQFLRHLPDAIPRREFTLEGNLIRIPEKNGAVWIRMAELGERQLGQLHLPMMRLDFAFEGRCDTEINEFMDTYDVRALRGPGGCSLRCRDRSPRVDGASPTLKFAAGRMLSPELARR